MEHFYGFVFVLIFAFNSKRHNGLPCRRSATQCPPMPQRIFPATFDFKAYRNTPEAFKSLRFVIGDLIILTMKGNALGIAELAKLAANDDVFRPTLPFAYFLGSVAKRTGMRLASSSTAMYNSSKAASSQPMNGQRT